MPSNDGGIGRLQARLAAIPKAIRDRVQVATLEAADQMAATMRVLVPEDSGDLKDSITVTPGGQSTPSHSQPGGSFTVPANAVAITAGDTRARYGHLVEWGTENAEAQPFFFPAVRLGRKKAKSKMKAAVRKAIKETAK